MKKEGNKRKREGERTRGNEKSPLYNPTSSVYLIKSILSAKKWLLQQKRVGA